MNHSRLHDKPEKLPCDASCADSSRTLGIIHEFRRLYEDKMRIIEAEGSGDCNLQAKLSLQHDWIRDLNEQNEMLVRAVEELEQEATERVIALEEKLRQSSSNACEMQREMALKDKNLKMMREKLDDAILCKQMLSAEIEKECSKCYEIRKSMFDMRDSLTAEVAEKHDVILSLKRDVLVLEEQCKKAEQQTHFKDDIIKELRKEIKQLKLEVEEKTHAQLKQLESENVQLQAAIKKATFQLEMLENKSHLISEHSHLKQQYDDVVQRVCQIEGDKEELQRMMLAQEMLAARKIAELECALAQATCVKACVSQALQATVEQCDSRCATDPPPATEDKRVGDFCCACTTTGCQTEKASHVDILLDPIKVEEGKLEEVVQALQCSVSKMIVSETQTKQDRSRIHELESQLACEWRIRENEVHAARMCREAEINNLKKVIENVMSNLHNEKTRADNLQKAVDLYHNTVDTVKESESKFKQEVLGQKRTIQNLQEALVQTKQNLEELQEKSSFECVEHTYLVDNLIGIIKNAEKELQYYMEQYNGFITLVDNLREENIKLEENLFYNHQDLEMYEMRLAKYQSMYSKMEVECGCLRKEVEKLESQRNEKDLFTNDLTENLAECQSQLQHLYTLLGSETSAKVDKSEQITQLHIQLKAVAEELDTALFSLDEEQKKNAKLTKMVMKHGNATTTIQSEARLAHEKLQASAQKMFCDEQKIAELTQQVACCQETITRLQSDQCTLVEQLGSAQLKLNDPCDECEKFAEEIARLQNEHVNDACKYHQAVGALSEKIRVMELECQRHCKELQDACNHLIELRRNESALRQELIDTETKYHTQINQYNSEQERLVAVVGTLESELAHLTVQLQNGEVSEEVVQLRNEINTLVQAQRLLKTDNDQMQTQLAASDEKQRMVMLEFETCLNELHSDKEFLARKNEQLTGKLQALQKLCANKTESLEAMEMALAEAKSARDSLCIESKQVIDHVRSWLEEQRKINVDMSHRIRHKNDMISKLKQENMNLTIQTKQDSSIQYDTSTRRASNNCSLCPQTQPPQYSMQVLHSPPPRRNSWSQVSMDSAQQSLIDDSDWEASLDEEQLSDIWIHRVESLTEDLQRSNRYWKTKLNEQEYSVSRDK